jgi:hypothetical protein
MKVFRIWDKKNSRYLESNRCPHGFYPQMSNWNKVKIGLEGRWGSKVFTRDDLEVHEFDLVRTNEVH